jgi:hypothetical protein
MALVVPRRGEATKTAQILLELADSQWDVKTTTEAGGDMGVAFIIPDDLHDRYLAEIGQATEGEEEGDTAPRKRRGRPRKAAASVEQTDESDDDEEKE